MKQHTLIGQFKHNNNKPFKLKNIETKLSGKSAPEKIELKDSLSQDIQEIAKFQNKLYAENRQSLLIILQGMDSSGKDGTIKHIMSGINAQGVMVYSFKHPSTLELDHDFLWRHIIKIPEHGQITIFNRSHYENVLISKVHPELILNERIHAITELKEINQTFWKKRYKQIKHFEKRTIETGTELIKIFLHISKEEQCNRFLERIANEDKHWKFSSSDIEEREYWDAYQLAYEEAIIRTSTKKSPWYIIPADDKTQAHAIIGRILLHKLKSMKPSFPPKSEDEKKYMQKAGAKLKRELK